MTVSGLAANALTTVEFAENRLGEVDSHRVPGGVEVSGGARECWRLE
jgi:hypothetical protein